MSNVTTSFYLMVSAVCIVGCGSKDNDSGADGGEETFSEGVYSPDHLPEFHLTIPDAALAALENDPLVYQPGTFRYVPDDLSGEVIVNNVGIRLKGRASFRPITEKAAFKVKFSEFVSGQRFKGLRRITLNNMVQDPSAVRERLAYLMLREAGLDAPLCNHARVYVNDEYFGLYANVESLDESFLESHFDPPDGNLFDTVNEEYFVDMVPGNEQLFELETNQTTNDIADLLNLMAVLDGPQETFVDDAKTVIDLDQFLLAGAVQAVIADWDGYFGAKNNYKIYHDVATDRFVLFPWGLDQTFNIIDSEYTMLDYNIDGSSSQRDNGIVFAKCKQDEACLALYLEKVAEVVARFDSLNLEAELESILTQITDSLEEDTRRPHSDGDFSTSVERVREFLTERGDIVRDQLNQ